jgi:catechol 2,3-dioxygenase-like lactoylglutathione lyase family enzyme
MFYKRMAHVCIHARDLRRSLDYYRKLGFSECFQFTHKGSEYGRYLKIADDTFIEIFHEPKPGPVQNASLVHFCLESDDLDALAAHLDAQGIAHTPKSLGADHTWQIWLEDPDGNKFEVHQYTEKSMQRHGGVVEANWLD